LALVVNGGDLGPKSNVRIFHFSLRILGTQEVKDTGCSRVDVFDQLDPVGSKAQGLSAFHELNEVVDDIFSEKNFYLFEVEEVIAEHVPADRSSRSIY
jgi:hypothetical protein